MSPFEKLCFGKASAVMLVCAHPDDEVIGAGAQLPRWSNVTIVYVTNGAPRNSAGSKGPESSSVMEYAECRRKERKEAMRIINEQRSARRGAVDIVDLNFSDQEAAFHMVEIARSLAERMRRVEPEFVVTHPYEGGHPDHDSVAFSVSGACWILRSRGLKPPVHVEMTSYHADRDKMVTDEFLQRHETEGACLPLRPPEQALKRRLFAAYESQAKVLQYFQIQHESLRVAPSYDFESSPHVGRLWYENFDWGMKGAHWRHLAMVALANLNLEMDLHVNSGRCTYGGNERFPPFDRLENDEGLFAQSRTEHAAALRPG